MSIPWTAIRHRRFRRWRFLRQPARRPDAAAASPAFRDPLECGKCELAFESGSPGPLKSAGSDHPLHRLNRQFPTWNVPRKNPGTGSPWGPPGNSAVWIVLEFGRANPGRAGTGRALARRPPKAQNFQFGPPADADLM